MAKTKTAVGGGAKPKKEKRLTPRQQRNIYIKNLIHYCQVDIRKKYIYTNHRHAAKAKADENVTKLMDNYNFGLQFQV